MADFREQSTDAAVKVASTAATAADFSLVVAHSPNSPTPPGAAIIGKVGIDQTTPGTTNLVSLGNPSTTYSATISGLALAALATDVFTITGSATKTIKITKIYFNALQTTASQVIVMLLRRSTADTLGTSTAPAIATSDTANAAATAVVAAYTANPTTGTLLGNVYSQRVFVPGAATATDAQGMSVVFGDVGQQYMTLRGVAQQFCVNLAGITVTGGSANISIEWTES